MYQFLCDFMGFELSTNQAFFFGSIFIVIELLLLFSLIIGVIKLMK